MPLLIVNLYQLYVMVVVVVVVVVGGGDKRSKKKERKCKPIRRMILIRL